MNRAVDDNGIMPVDFDRLRTIQEKLNKISFTGCKEVLMGDTLFYWCFCRMKRKNTFRDVLTIVKDMMRCLTVSKYAYEVKGNGETILLFSNSYRGREDHLVSVNRLKKLLSNYIFFSPKEYSFSWFNIRAFLLLFVWLWQMRKIQEDFSVKLFLIWGILFCFVDYDNIVRVIKKKNIESRYFVTLCDVMEVDCYFTQKLKKAGLKTVTLQHGFLSEWGFRGSKSDYMFCYGKQTVEQAEEWGVDIHKYLPVGPLSHIERQAVNELKRPILVRKIGVFLTEDSLFEQNKEILEWLTGNRETFGWKVNVRFHPTSDRARYSAFLLDELEVNDACEFASLMDVVIIVGYSTTIIDSFCAGIPILIFAKQNDLKLDFMVFHSMESLPDKLATLTTEEYELQYNIAKKRFITGGSISQNYINAFKDIGLSI